MGSNTTKIKFSKIKAFIFGGGDQGKEQFEDKLYPQNEYLQSVILVKHKMCLQIL